MARKARYLSLTAGLLVLVMGYAACWHTGTVPKSRVSVRTDRERAIGGVNRAKPHDRPVPPKPKPDVQKKDKERGKILIGPTRKKTNCVGFALGRGEWEIDTTEIPKILEDNYIGIIKGKARVCDIVVYGDVESGYDHIGLVVEVTANGKPKYVRSTTGTSDYV